LVFETRLPPRASFPLIGFLEHSDELFALLRGVGEVFEDVEAALARKSVGDVALQAASLLAVKLGSYHDCKRARAVLQALLEVAGAA
jgi:hypothetical protein